MHAVFLPFDAQAQAGAVEKAARIAEDGCAHRVVVGIHLIDQHQRAGRGAVKQPAAFVELFNLIRRQCAAALLGLESLQVASEFTHQIAAWNPHRQGHFLQRGRFCYCQCDSEKMRLQIGDFNPVVDGGAGRRT